MKAVSVRQPWAHMIMCGTKKYEYRSWKTDYRGDLLICSSAAPKVERTACGYALCIVNLTDVLEVNRHNYRSLGLSVPPAQGEKLYAWKLENIRVIKPFPVKGKLNFYHVDDAMITGEQLLTGKNELQKWLDDEIAPISYEKMQSHQKRENNKKMHEVESDRTLLTKEEVRQRLAMRELEYLIWKDEED